MHHRPADSCQNPGPAPALATDHSADPALVIERLTRQLAEVRQLNRRLEISNSELQSELASLRYRMVDEACTVLKGRPLIRRASRLVLPVARYFRWAMRQRTRPAAQ